MASASYFIGVDVGTGSARAGLFDHTGRRLAISTRLIKTWNPQPDFYQQSSDDIWNSCVEVVRNVIGNVDVKQIKGIGFDATCSLVVLGDGNLPVTVSPTGHEDQNVIMWMDHRAKEETDVVNNTQHPSLQFVGGKVSIEMQLPKLLWLKKNLPETWNQKQLLFDLPDFLTWKATGAEDRSQCSLVCKWNYLASDKGWPHDLLQKIGLEDLLKNEARLIGGNVKIPGSHQGQGLSEEAAKELGLCVGTSVGVSLIDAYAGALGLLGCKLQFDCSINERLAVICGTSSCHMQVIPDPCFVTGVWGPYADVLLPNNCLLEAGQSATGKLLDHVIESHPSYQQMKTRLAALPNSRSIPEEIAIILKELAMERQTSVTQLTKDIHVWPDYHGNRSPLADPNLKGMISGLTLDNSETNLALMYLATLQALAYGTRHIIDSMRDHGAPPVGCLLLCGGLVKSELFVQTMADATSLPVVIPHEPESVLLGSAMLGACASRYFTSFQETMEAMGGTGRYIQPSSWYGFHERKYRVFLKMFENQREYDRLMNSD